MARQVAVINAGSSSIKFAVFNEDADQSLIFRGQVEKIGVAPHMAVEGADGETLVENEWGPKDLNHRSATKVILQTAIALLGGEAIEVIGHRVVHGGTDFTEPTRLDRAVLSSLESLIPLAPLHQPHNLAPIEAIMAEAPPERSTSRWPSAPARRAISSARRPAASLPAVGVGCPPAISSNDGGTSAAASATTSPCRTAEPRTRAAAAAIAGAAFPDAIT